MQRILCVWLPYWATTRLSHAPNAAAPAERQACPPDGPLATVMAVRGVQRLASVCARAEAAGLQAGQTLTQARALCPALTVAEAQPREDAAALAALARWCTRATPLAAAAPPDTLWLDIAGCAHLFGGEAVLAADLARRMARWGLQACWAVAGTAGAAHALARHAPGTVVPAGQQAGQQAGALAGLPIEALRLAADTAAGLRRLGLKTVGALDRLPRGELAARFGQDTLLRLDQAHGRAREPIGWPQPPPDWTEQERLAEPILTTEACHAVLALLAGRLCARLAAQRVGGRHFVALFRRVDGSLPERAIATALPVHDPAYLLRLLAERLDGLDPGFGIEAVTLWVSEIEASAGRQPAFGLDISGLGASGAASAPLGQQRLAQLIDTLANRLRPGRLWRFAPRESHIPERAVQAAPPLGQAIRWEADRAAPRPIRLLARPEPVQVTALLPDEPPVQFRWRGALHRVRAATGPERIAEEWWSEDAGAARDGRAPQAARDYYQVEDGQGARYWMFRMGGAWFLHGFFG